MTKRDVVEESINEALESSCAKLDVSVGKVKRDAKTGNVFATGVVVAEVANTCLSGAEELVEILASLHGRSRKPFLFGKKKFNEMYITSAKAAFSYFSSYCHDVTEEIAAVTKQNHMYEKKYRRLHETLRELELSLDNRIRSSVN